MAINYDKYIKSTGTHYIANSGSDERGKYNGGQAGDQTGKEWQLRSWYNRPWTHVFRHPDPRVRRLIAELGIEGALNDNIGYDQYQRDTFWAQLKKVGYRPANITVKCEEDCSAGVNSIVKAVGYLLGIDKLKSVRNVNTSRNTKAGLQAAGFETLTASKYRSSGDYLLPGDVLLCENHHVAINVTRGKKATGDVADSVDTTSKPIEGLRVGDSGEKVKALQERLIAAGFSVGTDGADGDFGENTEAAVKALQKACGLAETGVADNATMDALAAYKADESVSGGITVTGNCNIRTGPGTDYVVLGVAHEGETFESINTAGWVPVKYKGEICWVSGKYVKG